MDSCLFEFIVPLNSFKVFFDHSELKSGCWDYSSSSIDSWVGLKFTAVFGFIVVSEDGTF